MRPFSIRYMRLFLVAAMLCLCLPAGKLLAKPADRQVIVLFISGFSFTDLAKLKNYPHVDKWISKSAIGAMTIRPAGARNEENAYLLLGSGGQAVYTEASGTAYHAMERMESGETAAERMQRYRGDPVRLSEETLLFPGIYRLQVENENKPFTARIGLLGNMLSANGMIAAVFGNSDAEGKKHRHAALFAMDERGIIPAGDLSSRTYLADPSFPGGHRTDYAYLLERMTQERRSGVLVAEVSDLARLYQAQSQMDSGHFQRQYNQVLTDLDQFLGNLLQTRKANQMVIVTSALVNEAAVKEKSLLTPLLLWQEGGAGTWLQSATTRQAGVISGLDLLPTLLHWLAVPLPQGLLGHPLTSSPRQAGNIEALLTHVQEIDRVYENRSPIMYTYVMLQIIILVAAALFWLWKKDERGKAAEKLRRGIRLSLLSMLFYPLLFLLEPLLSWSVPPPVILGVIIMFALGGALIVESWRLPRMLMLVAGMTIGAVLIDGFTGAEAMQRSYLGYDPVIGARFYGLGNEYEGVVVGATILFVSALYQLRKPVGSVFCMTAAVMLFGLVLVYMGAPSLGANAGGFLAATVGFGVAGFRLQEWRVGKKGLLLITGGLLAGVGALIIINLSSSQPLTHVGRVANDMVQGNWDEVMKIVERKLEMNWRLIRISGWSKVFAVSLVVIGLLSLRTDRYLRNLSGEYPYLVKGFTGLIAGSLAGLLLNDSGIVTAATSIIFFVVPALSAAIGEPLDREYSTNDTV
ncbi:hypothetical protein [Brevibacillus migulae]|uniref:hypothetical protein n=1 Tax=Brevibacillus migulae TaxID=1644114 RepID=UPI001F1FCFF2|nr:hypothetical protein [Brevibacillus migulae]